MKVWILAGAFTALTVPFAAAAETTSGCEVDDTRRIPQVRIDSGSPSGSAPPTAAPTSRQAPAQRTADATAAEREAAEAARAFTERRRNGKRIPDAELIGPRGAL